MKNIPFVFLMSLVLGLGLTAADANAQTVYYYTDVHYSSASRYVDGYTTTYLDYYAGFYYDPAVLGELYRSDMNEIPLDSGYDEGYADIVDAEVYLYTSNYVEGKTYCTSGTHFVIDNYTEYRYTVARLYPCITIPVPPTPTPTPCPTSAAVDCQTPTPTPTPTVTPTPTPAPTPTAVIEPIDVVEKNGTKQIKISVLNNSSGMTSISLETLTGTGKATFDDDSSLIVINGNVTDQVLTIKGVTESSQADNITIKAKINDGASTDPHDEFTVATITSLVFNKFAADYKDLDANPGNGYKPPKGSGPDPAQGKRIFPDKIDVNDAKTGTADRSLVKVKAVISPAIPNVKVNFKTFDLDDPSSDSAPIDVYGNSGNDNNGTVPNGTSAGLLSGTGCTAALNSLKDCPTASDGTFEATFKTTMQPGDNFAVTAGLSYDVLEDIRFEAADGTKLTDSRYKIIPISGQPNSENVPAIRTEMLTVWRNLHIEVDSMKPAHGNFVRGNISGNKTVGAGDTKTINVTAPDLEVNRFEKGRMELAAITNFMDIVSNTDTTVTVKNSTANNIVIANNVNCQLSDSTATITEIGVITAGQTLMPNQVVTIPVSSTHLDVNAFAGGQLFITPDLVSLDVKSNKINSVEVTNTTSTSIVIADATNFRLYDDDDMNDDGVKDGDEGDNVPSLDLNLLTPNSDSPANNLFAAAFTRINYDLPGSNEKIPFSTNVTDTDILNLYSHFNNQSNEANPDFWTVYILDGYQWDTANDADPGYDPVTKTGNSWAFAKVDALNGIGVTVFRELIRPTEFDNIDRFNSVHRPDVPSWRTRPVEEKYTVVHEVGHLFSGYHEDLGIMDSSSTRIDRVFSNVTLNKIRGGIYTNYDQLPEKITHP